MPVSIRSLQGPKLTVLPTTTGTGTARQLLEAEPLQAARAVARGGDSALDDEHVGARLDRRRREPLGIGRRAGYGADGALTLYRADPLADQLQAHRLRVRPLQQRPDLALRRRRDLREHGVGVIVARLHAVEVEHGQAAELEKTVAERGLTTASMPAARKGSSSFRLPSVKETSVSSGLIVTSPGTIDTSSNP